MINTKWLLSCLVFAIGTLLTASAQAQTFTSTINTTLLGNPQGVYNVTIVKSPVNTFALTITQTSAPAGNAAFVDGISVSFFNAANLPQTTTSLSGKSVNIANPLLFFTYNNNGAFQSSAVFDDNTGTVGPNPLPVNTSVNAFNQFQGNITLTPTSSVSAISVGLTGNGGSGNAFVNLNVVPECNGSILLLAALLPIGILVARRRSAKSAV